MQKKQLGNYLVFIVLALCATQIYAHNIPLEDFPPDPYVIAGIHSYLPTFPLQHIIFLSRLAVAIILGCLIGLSHSFRRGSIAISIKTYGAVTLGSAAFATVQAALYLATGGLGNPLQNLGSVTTGIGFLCAAVIFKQGLSVKGLSTAATLWSSAAVGVATGMGFYEIGLTLTILLILLHLVQKYRHKEPESESAENGNKQVF